MTSRNLFALCTLLLCASACSENGKSDPRSTTYKRDTSAPVREPAEVAQQAAQDDMEAPEATGEEETSPADTAAQVATPAESDDVAEEQPMAAAPEPELTSATPLEEVDTAELTMPMVVLSHGHDETCLVKVGQKLPDITLEDLEGREQSLAKLLGSKLTVVVFWNSSRATALEELRDLTPDVVKRFSPHGVAVVAINALDSPQDASAAVKSAGATFANLSDPEGRALGQLTSGKVPRTYLVDPSGKVLWFDMEYSRSTRRDLAQAIRHALAGP